MRLECLLTCLDFAERRNPVEPAVQVDLLGVFRRLDKAPGRFIVYSEIQLSGMDSTDGLGVRIRCRKPGVRGEASTWHETEEHLVLVGLGPDVVQLPVAIEDPYMPGGRSIVQILIDGRIEGEHVVDFGA